MRYLQSIFIILFFILSVFFSFGIKETFADVKYITQIDVDSGPEKIKKVQEVFSGLGLYNGEIDGKFSSIKETIINYQLENGIISSKTSSEAGYFGAKTIKSLKENYGKNFEDLQKKFLVLEAPEIEVDTYFIVTAYYTPIPGQKVYSTGSYEKEIRLNGGGNTASGKEPSIGTIAAPRNYAFGTKIYLEGFGIGVVEDRGGAIVNSGDRGHSYDRLDIWMGYGDEAREKTKKWGIKTVKGKILSSDAFVDVEFDINPIRAGGDGIEKYKNLYVSAENPNFDSVKLLQELLIKAELYSGKIDGDYDSVKDILIDFQVKNGIIKSASSEEAGYFGKKTYEFFRKNYSSYFVKKEENKKSENVSVKVENSTKKEILTDEDKKLIEDVRDLFLAQAKANYTGKQYNNYIKDTKQTLKNFYEKKLTDEKKIEILKYLIEIL